MFPNFLHFVFSSHTFRPVTAYRQNCSNAFSYISTNTCIRPAGLVSIHVSLLQLHSWTISSAVSLLSPFRKCRKHQKYRNFTFYTMTVSLSHSTSLNLHTTKIRISSCTFFSYTTLYNQPLYNTTYSQ